MPLTITTPKQVGPQKSSSDFTAGTRSYGTVYFVNTNSNHADPFELRSLLLTTLPRGWPSDTACRLGAIDLEQIREKRSAWYATPSYSLYAADDENPLGKRRELSYSWSRFQRTIDRDIYGAPIVNRALDPTPIEEDDARAEMQLVFNIASFSPAIAHQYRNAVNLDPWWGLDTMCAKVAGLEAVEKQTSSGLVYFTVTAKFEINGDNWKRKLVNRGFYTLARYGGNLVTLPNGMPLKSRLKDNQGQPTEEPQFLSENGESVLAPGDPIVIDEWETLPKKPFSSVFPTS